MAKPNRDGAGAIGAAADRPIGAGTSRRAAKLWTDVSFGSGEFAQPTGKGGELDRCSRPNVIASTASHRTHATQYEDGV